MLRKKLPRELNMRRPFRRQPKRLKLLRKPKLLKKRESSEKRPIKPKLKLLRLKLLQLLLDKKLSMINLKLSKLPRQRLIELLKNKLMLKLIDLRMKQEKRQTLRKRPKERKKNSRKMLLMQLN